MKRLCALILCVIFLCLAVLAVAEEAKAPGADQQLVIEKLYWKQSKFDDIYDYYNIAGIVRNDSKGTYDHVTIEISIIETATHIKKQTQTATIDNLGSGDKWDFTALCREAGKAYGIVYENNRYAKVKINQKYTVRVDKLYAY